MGSTQRFVKPTLWTIVAILAAATVIGPYLLVNQLIVWQVETPQCRTLCHRQGMTFVRYDAASQRTSAVCECRAGEKTISRDVRFHLFEGDSGTLEAVLRLGILLVTFALGFAGAFLLVGLLAGRLRRSRATAPAGPRTPT